MTIIDKTTSNKTKFGDISIGDVFRQGGSIIYMKIETVNDDEGFTLANAVNLHDGTLWSFLSDYDVTLLNCECIITNK